MMAITNQIIVSGLQGPKTLRKATGKGEENMRKLILYEYQKKRVCEHYDCSDSYGNQYPCCDEFGSGRCPLHNAHRLLYTLNEPCEHPRTVCVNEEGNAGVFCTDCHEQLEREC